MAEWEIEHRKSSLVVSASFPVVKWRSRSVAKSVPTMKGNCAVFWTIAMVIELLYGH